MQRVPAHIKQEKIAEVLLEHRRVYHQSTWIIVKMRCRRKNKGLVASPSCTLGRGGTCGSGKISLAAKQMLIGGGPKCIRFYH